VAGSGCDRGSELKPAIVDREPAIARLPTRSPGKEWDQVRPTGGLGSNIMTLYWLLCPSLLDERTFSGVCLYKQF
jgi:hypothetical protein